MPRIISAGGANYGTIFGQQWALASGVETIPRPFVTSQTLAIATQDIRLSYFVADQSFASTQVKTYTGSTAAGATPTLCRVGLYTVASNGDLTLVASIANDTTLWAAPNTEYVSSWSVGVGVTAGTLYALGTCIVTAAATPTFVGPAMLGLPTAVAATAPRISAARTGQADLVTPITSGTLAASIRFFYSVVV